MKPDMNKARQAHAALTSKGHGGAREGAGRKEVYSAEQKPVRLTVEISGAEAAAFDKWTAAKGLKSRADAVRALIASLKNR